MGGADGRGGSDGVRAALRAGADGTGVAQSRDAARCVYGQQSDAGARLVGVGVWQGYGRGTSLPRDGRITSTRQGTAHPAQAAGGN